MISFFIAIFCLAALVQFVIAYCRSLIVTYGKVEVSQRIWEIARVTPGTIQPGDFQQLLGLVRRAPDPGDDAREIGAVWAYFAIVRLVGTTISPLSKFVSHWVDRELALCIHFAAVSLDRRLAPASM